MPWGQFITFSDRILAIALIVWQFGWFVAFLIVTAIHFTLGTSQQWWTEFRHFYILLRVVIGIPATIWFTVGGILDIKALFRRLEAIVRDPTDNGSVSHEPERPADAPRARQ